MNSHGCHATMDNVQHTDPSGHGEVRRSTDTLLRRSRWLGLGGTVLLAIGALGVGVLPRPDPLANAPVLRLLRDGIGAPTSGALAVIGMALWVVAWWSLRRRIGNGLTTRWMSVTAALWSLPLAVAPPLLSRDVYSYAVQGQLAEHGLNPYEHGPAELSSSWDTSASAAWDLSRTPYGPLFVLIARACATLGELSGHLEVTILALRLFAIAAVALLAVYLPQLARSCGVDESRAQWLGLGCPLVLAHSISGAHNDIIMAALIVAGLAQLARRRPLLAGALLGAAIAVKAPALLVLPLAVLLALAVERGRSTGRKPSISSALVVIAAAVAALTVVTVIAGFGWGWVNALHVSSGSVQWTSAPTSWGIATRWLSDPFATPSANDAALRIARAIGTVLLAIVLLAIWGRATQRVYNAARTTYVRSTPNKHALLIDTPIDTESVRYVVRAAGLALLAASILGPTFHPWYFLWPLILLAASTRSISGRTAAASAAAALCFIALPDGYNLARSTMSVGVIAVVVATLVLPASALFVAGRRSYADRIGAS
ncbi:MAG: DUF2029 domain-containing protein [Acidimicrobiales bacterium]|nr:MAG: DUF2029 domain-containing protein [Acidimicrobiales bacterium]